MSVAPIYCEGVLCVGSLGGDGETLGRRCDHRPSYAKLIGLQSLSVFRVKWPGTPIVVLSGEQDDRAHEAGNRGAFAWGRKGGGVATLVEILASVVQQSVHA